MSRFGSPEKERLNKINCFEKYDSTQFKINWKSIKSYEWRFISGSLRDVNLSENTMIDTNWYNPENPNMNSKNFVKLQKEVVTTASVKRL